MWEAEPRLYWRVKLNGKWTWRTAVIVTAVENSPPDWRSTRYLVEAITPEVLESE